MAALTEAEMLEVVSDLYGDSDDDLGGGPIVAPTEHAGQPNGRKKEWWRRRLCVLLQS